MCYDGRSCDQYHRPGALFWHLALVTVSAGEHDIFAGLEAAICIKEAACFYGGMSARPAVAVITGGVAMASAA